MSYIGNQPPDIGAYDVESFDGGGTSFTLKRAATVSSVLLFIDGVRQTPTDAYTVSGVTLTTTATTPSGTDNVTVMFMGDVVDIGAPSADTVSTAKIQDDAVTAAKLANSINTEIAANTAKVTNATHTGDVTGATALTIATDAVDIAMLSATGTASATTFLRGDNAWAAGGKIGQVLQTFHTGTETLSSTTATTIPNFTVTITPAATSSKILVMVDMNTGGSGSNNTNFELFRDTTQIYMGDAAGVRPRTFAWTQMDNGRFDFRAGAIYLDSPSTTSAVAYSIKWYAELSSTIYLNRSQNDANLADYDGRGASSITVMEVLA